MDLHHINRTLLLAFVPLNALSDERLDYLLEGQEVETLPPGTVLCHRGENDGNTIYLLSGVVDIENAGGAVSLDASDIDAAYALAPEQPRQATVRARTSVNVLRFESKRLDRVLAWDQSAGTLQETLMARYPDEDSAWINQLLQSQIFYRISPANVVELFKRLRPLPVRRGQRILQRGEQADCCYFIKQGEAEVSIPGDIGPVTLAFLEKGQYFGEEGLLIEGVRNADVTMASDGLLMRLDKADFDLLLKAPSLAKIDFANAQELVEAGQAYWLDVRLADEQRHGILRNAICLPLQSLRVKSRLLSREQRYIVYCDTGRRSAAAAFLLGVMGYDTNVLESGLRSLMPAERDRFLVRG